MRPANNRDKQIKIWLIIEKIYDLEYGIRVLNYKHLHYFQCVARAGSVVRAAERLHLTPQTLSGQLSQFEARLGITLFNRVGRRLELTKTGRLALSYAEEIFQAGSERNSAALTNLFISQRLTRVLKPSKRSLPTIFLPQKADFQS